MMQKLLIEQGSPLKPSIATAAFSLQHGGSLSSNVLICDVSTNSSISVSSVDDERITTHYSYPLTRICGDLGEMLQSFQRHYNKAKLNQLLQSYSTYPEYLDKKNLILLEDDQVLTCGDADRLFFPFRCEIEKAFNFISEWSVEQRVEADQVFLIGEYATFFLTQLSISHVLPKIRLSSSDLYLADGSTIGIQIETLTTTLEKSIKQIELLKDGVWVDESVDLLECGQIGSFGKDLTMNFWSES